MSDANAGSPPDHGDDHYGGLTFWEPWRPSLGDRVTVRYAGECNVDWGRIGDGLGENLGHPPEFDYRTGRVFRVDPDYGAHCYAVVFDVPVSVARKGGIPCMGAHFAAIELEPIDLPDSATVEDIARAFQRLRLNDA